MSSVSSYRKLVINAVGCPNLDCNAARTQPCRDTFDVEYVHDDRSAAHLELVLTSLAAQLNSMLEAAHG